MLLSVKHLCVSFVSSVGEHVQAVRNVSFTINSGETLAIVGESGSGKSVTALTLTKLLSKKAHVSISGEVLLEKYGNILLSSESQIRKIRGAEIAYIFQDPSTSLNPALTIGYQIKEAVCLHQPKENAKALSLQLLENVGLHDSKRIYHAYPFELSGGMQQRAMIAIALACRPKLLVADEPTTALDVTLQKEIIDLLVQIQKQQKLAILLITHNLGLVKGFAHRVLVMQRGEMVEQGTTQKILYHPEHPYTKALLQCVPSLKHPRERLATISDFL